MQKVPQTVGAFFMSLNMPAWAIALIFDVLILMIGTFIDVSPAILLLTPSCCRSWCSTASRRCSSVP